MKEGQNIINFLVLSAILLFALVLIPMFIGLGKGGFAFSASGQSQNVLFNFLLFQFLFYSGPGIGFIVGLTIVFFAEVLILKGDEKYGSSILFSSPGEIPSMVGKKYFGGFKGAIKLLMISVIVFSILGLYTAYNHQTFTGVGALESQFTVFDNLTFSATLVAISENLGAAFAFALFLMFLRIFARKVKMSREVFIILAVILALVVFLSYGYINHQLRYSSDEVAIQFVIAFWAFGGLITVISGSFIPFLVLHMCNNLFYQLSSLYSSDIILIYTIGLITVLAILYVLFFVRRKSKK